MHFVVCKDNLFALFYLIYVCNGKNELDIIVSNLMFDVFFSLRVGNIVSTTSMFSSHHAVENAVRYFELCFCNKQLVLT